MKEIFLILFFIIIFLVNGCSSASLKEQKNEESVHIHADFKVYINNKPINFSVMGYQLRDKSVHVENGIGEVIHVHKKSITIGYFFETLGIEFNNTCIKIPIEGTFCNEDDKKLRFFVNGVENSEFEDYEIRNLDKILISYGKGDIQKQLESVTDFISEQ